ncbi:hypothetical protein [Sphingobium sp.]|uniref:hypothetical protein n=1 Tax=Sphingobium sp. TaxID=1912891 RepID=UPI003BB5793E
MTSSAILLIGDDASALDALTRALMGRQVMVINEFACAPAMLEQAVPSLIILTDAPQQAAWAQAIRSGAGRCAAMPILACAATGHAAVPAGCDAILPFPASPASIDSHVAAWLPQDDMARARALAERFGAAQIMPMVDRLRGELETALASLDRGEDAGHAHRIAGVAGTLGFAAVSESWLILSEQGGKDAQKEARRTARIAIAEISRGTETNDAC